MALDLKWTIWDVLVGKFEVNCVDPRLGGYVLDLHGIGKGKDTIMQDYQLL